MTALADDGEDGSRVRWRLRQDALMAPEIVDLEVASVLRRLVANGTLNARRAGVAIRDLGDLPLRRAPHRPLLRRCWQLRQNVTPYDAAYVALAEALRVPLVTGDARLASAPGIRCAVEVL